MEKSVSAVTGVCGERIAFPDWPVQSDPSGKTIAAETPGYEPPARMASSSFCSAAAVTAVRPAGAGPGVANREVGTGTIVRGMTDAEAVALGATDIATVGVGVGVGGGVMTGDGVVVPHAATAAISTRAAATQAGQAL
jgi:hypothetical protein